MASSTHLSLLGCALNGPDLSSIRDICLRLHLIKLQSANQRLTSLSRPRADAVENFRNAYWTAKAMSEERLCWRDRRTLSRILVQAERLDTYLSAQLA